MEQEQTLSEFLQTDQRSTFVNPAGVQFFNAEGSFFVCTDYPGIVQPEHICIELYQQFETVDELMTLLHIARVEQLEALTPEELLPLYEQEEMNIVCTLEGAMPRELSFRKYQGGLWARNANEEIHQVKEPLEKPGYFIAYTLRYYEVHSN